MQTRKSTRSKPEARLPPPPAAVHESDDDDEAPEVVSKESAKEQALQRLRHEEEAAAVRAAEAAAKRKRKTRTVTTGEDAAKEGEADVDADEADGEEEAAPALPANVLSALANRDEEVRTEQALEEARGRQQRKRALAAAAATRTHIRDFGSVQVQTLETVSSSANASRALSESAKDFLSRRSAPKRERMNVLEGHASMFTKKQKATATRT